MERLSRCRREYSGLGGAAEFFKKLPRSRDRAIPGIANEMKAELDNPRVPTRPQPPDEPMPPDVARMIDRAVLFLKTDQPYVHGRWGWGSFVILGSFFTGLVLLVVTSVVAELTGQNPAPWLVTAGFWLVMPFFGSLMLGMVLSYFGAGVVIFCVRVLRKDLTAYEEEDDECWPFFDRAAWEAARDASSQGLPVSVDATARR